MKNQLTLTNINKQFDVFGVPTTVLGGISLTINQGGQYAIAGISGSGKSTLLGIIGGIEEPTTGTVNLAGEPVAMLARQNPRLFFSTYVGFIFQSPHLIYELNVLENITLRARLAGSNTEQANERARALLDILELGDKATFMPAQLSLGQAQRVAVARALLSRPYFILADEPTAHLDASTRDKVVKTLTEYQQEGGTLVITSHDPHVIDALETVYTLRNGQLALTRNG